MDLSLERIARDHLIVTGSVQKSPRTKYFVAMLNVPIITQDTVAAFVKDVQEGRTPTVKHTQTSASTKELMPRKATSRFKQICREKEDAFVREFMRIFEEEKPESESLFLDKLRNWKTSYQELEKTSVETYEGYMDNKVIPFFEQYYPKLKVGELELKHLQRFVNYMGLYGRSDGEGGVSKESIRKYLVPLTSVIKWCKRQRWLRENPVEDIQYSMEIFGKKEEFEAAHLEMEDIVKLLNQLVFSDMLDNPDDEYAWGFVLGILLAIFYGYRRGEIYGFREIDADFEADTIRVYQTKVRAKRVHIKSPKSKESKAVMPLLPFVKDYMRAYIKRKRRNALMYGFRYDPEGLLVSKDDGTPFGLDYINQRLQTMLHRCNMPIVTLHGLRHSTATAMRVAGQELEDVQNWLRHADKFVTRQYAEHNKYRLRLKPAATINEIFGQAIHDGGFFLEELKKEEGTMQSVI